MYVLVRVLTDDDYCTDEGTPPLCAPSAWFNKEINVDGWCVQNICIISRTCFIVSLVWKSSDPDCNWSLSCDHRLQCIIEMS